MTSRKVRKRYFWSIVEVSSGTEPSAHCGGGGEKNAEPQVRESSFLVISGAGGGCHDRNDACADGITHLDAEKEGQGRDDEDSAAQPENSAQSAGADGDQMMRATSK